MEFQIKRIESVRVAYKSYRGDVTKAGRGISEIFKAIHGKSCGAPFFAYNSVDNETGTGEMEICVPTMAESVKGQVFIKEYPSVKALSVIYTGPYDKLPDVYKEAFDYIHNNNLKVQAPWREVFIKGPGIFLKGNPEKYVTEIIVPIEEV